MGNEIVIDGEVNLDIPIDGVAVTVIEVGHDTGIDTIVFNADYTLTFNMTNGETFTTGSIRGEQGESGIHIGADAPSDENKSVWIDTDGDPDAIITDVRIGGTSIVQSGVADIPLATTTTAGLMSAQDKTRLDDIYADYSSALTALGVIE